MTDASQQAERGSKLAFNCYLVLLGFLAVGLRTGAAWHWHSQATADSHYLRLGDSHGYWTLAGHIARGEPYQYGSPNASIFRAPLMPILLSPFTLIEDQWSAVLCARLIAGNLLGIITVALVAWLAGRLAGRQAALVSAALASCYPGAIGMSVVILSEMLFVPLLLGYLLSWHSAWQASGSIKRITLALLTGLIGGLATLTRPSWLLFTPFMAVLGLLYPSYRKTHLQIVLAIGLGMCLAMTPWWIRNYQITGKLVLTTLQVGPSLLDSFHPGATGGSDEDMRFMRTIEQEQLQADQHAEKPLQSTLEWRINQRAQTAALSWCKQNPTQLLRLGLAKFSKTWSLWPDGGNAGSTAMRMAITVSSFGALSLAIWGSLVYWSSRRLMLAICWSPCLYFTLLHMVFVGSVRYREPAMMVLLAVAGGALVTLLYRHSSPIQDSARANTMLPDRSSG